MPLSVNLKPSNQFQLVSEYWPGVLVCGLVASAAQFLSEHYGAPAMLMALLLGLSLHFLVAEGQSVGAGVKFCSKKILRVGVALLGARISFEVFIDLGVEVIALIVAALVATIASGYAFSKLLGRGWRLALLTSGAVAICGASAAMAIAAVLPRNEYSERNLTFTVFGVTMLSTVAMIIYPIVVHLLGLDPTEAGIFLGGTIHDVAQVVGAGFSVSADVGETSATVKLIRVSLLAPVVIIMILSFRYFMPEVRSDGSKPPILPFFVVAFILLAAANSLGMLPEQAQSWAWAISRWAMLAAIAGVGMSTELRRIVGMPLQCTALIVAETLFIGGFVLVGITWFL